MKKVFAAFTLLAGTVAGQAQGLIQFYNYGASVAPGSFLGQAIFTPSSLAVSTYSVSYGGYTVMEQIGRTPNDVPSGRTTFQGTGLSGTVYDAQLLAGPAGITTPNGTIGGVGLAPVGTPLNFFAVPGFTGLISHSETIALPTETYFAPDDLISIAIASWADTGADGPAPTLAQAQADGYAWGISPVVQTTQGLGSMTSTAAPMPTTIESFSLGIVVPEPGAITLGVTSASALVLSRGKAKQYRA
jgi:hypothetical protein